MHNAYVTNDSNGRLVSESTVHVGEAVAVVPERTVGGGIFWAPRINAALRTLGWRMAPGTDWDATSWPTRTYFTAVPIVEGS